jgi:hypothetical protein
MNLPTAPPSFKLAKYEDYWVLRDDLLPGGTKSRFLEQLLPPGYNEYVYASPVYGAFQIALAATCQRLGKRATIFCAKRQEPHPNTLAAKAFGARILQVSPGYLSNAEAKARQYCNQTGAYKLKFGADYPQAIECIANVMRGISKYLGDEPPEIWCALGSGTLTRGILAGTDEAVVIAVQVGKQTTLKHERLIVLPYPLSFDKPSHAQPPFPSTANYDRKAWECMQRVGHSAGALFWNVY